MTKELKEKKGMAIVPAPEKIMVSKKKLILKIKEQGAGLYAEAKALVIKDDIARSQAAELRAKAKQLLKVIEENFLPSQKTAYQIYNFVKDGIKDMNRDADGTVTNVDDKMSDYDLMRKRESDAAKAKAETDKAELDRKEREKLLTQAAKAEEKGKDGKAEILREQANQVNNFVPFDPGPEKQVRTDSGLTSGSSDFDVFILDPMAIIRQIAAGTITGVVNSGRDKFGNIIEFKITSGALKRFVETKKIGDILPTIPGLRLKEKIGYKSFGTGNGK